MSDTFLPGSGFDTYEEQDKVLVGLCGGRGCRAAVPAASSLLAVKNRSVSATPSRQLLGR